MLQGIGVRAAVLTWHWVHSRPARRPYIRALGATAIRDPVMPTNQDARSMLATARPASAKARDRNPTLGIKDVAEHAEPFKNFTHIPGTPLRAPPYSAPPRRSTSEAQLHGTCQDFTIRAFLARPKVGFWSLRRVGVIQLLSLGCSSVGTIVHPPIKIPVKGC